MKGNIDNLYALFGRATDAERKEFGQAFYRYHGIMRDLAQENGVTLPIAAAVFSSLSPNNDYIGNIRDARKMLEASSMGLGIDDFTVSTYGHNKRKAWAIVKGADPLDEIIALKTRNFYLNISFPDNPEPVTVDGHMYWAWHGQRGRVTGHKGKGDAVTDRTRAASMNPRLYHEIELAVRSIAINHGLKGHQAQSIIWHAYRQRYNVLGTRQLDLLPRDLMAANGSTVQKKPAAPTKVIVPMGCADSGKRTQSVQRELTLI